MLGLKILLMIILSISTALSIPWFIIRLIDAIRYGHLGSEIFKELTPPSITFTFSVVFLVLLLI